MGGHQHLLEAKAELQRHQQVVAHAQSSELARKAVQGR